MLIIESIALCTLFGGICYFNTGNDEKNIKSFSSYPDEVQQIIKENPILKSKIRITKPLVSFVSNILIFGVVLLGFGLFIRKTNFISNFINILILGQILNAFDFFIIDLMWWRNSKRIRFAGTEDNQDIYRNPKKHFISFLKGILVFLIVAIIDGLLLSMF